MPSLFYYSLVNSSWTIGGSRTSFEHLEEVSDIEKVRCYQRLSVDGVHMLLRLKRGRGFGGLPLYERDPDDNEDSLGQPPQPPSPPALASFVGIQSVKVHQELEPIYVA